MNLGHGTLLGVMANALTAFVDGEVEQIVRLIKGEISNLAEFGLDGLTFTLHTYRCILRAIKKASGPLGMTAYAHHHHSNGKGGELRQSNRTG